MKQKANNLVTKPFLKQELKKLEKKLTGSMGQGEIRLGKVETRMGKVENRLGKVEERLQKVDRSLLAFKGEVEDRFQSLEDKIDKSEGRVVGLLGEVMIEIKELRQSHEIFTGKTYDNVDRLDNHEARIKILEQRSPTVL